jgi:hypothetical protein
MLCLMNIRFYVYRFHITDGHTGTAPGYRHMDKYMGPRGRPMAAMCLMHQIRNYLAVVYIDYIT